MFENNFYPNKINKKYDKTEFEMIKNSYERTIHSNKGKMMCSFINSYHNDIDGNEVVFNFGEESEGTKFLAGIIGFVLLTIDKGGVLFVD